MWTGRDRLYISVYLYTLTLEIYPRGLCGNASIGYLHIAVTCAGDVPVLLRVRVIIVLNSELLL